MVTKISLVAKAMSDEVLKHSEGGNEGNGGYAIEYKLQGSGNATSKVYRCGTCNRRFFIRKRKSWMMHSRRCAGTKGARII